MANRLKGEVAVEIGEGAAERTVIFRLGINELIGLQDAWEMKDDDEKFLLALDDKRSLKRRRALVRAAMLSRQPDTTDEQAGEVISELGIRRVDEIIVEALAWALPPKQQVQSGVARGKGAAASPGTLPS